MEVKKSKTSILKAVLLFFGIIILIGFAISFGWIAGIIWLIFFRKKLNCNPKKQKYITIAVSILSALSFILFVNSIITNSSLESITISCDIDGQELEIGQDYIVNIEYSPKDAELSNFVYNIDGSCATFSKSNADDSKAILHTTSEGKALISVSNGEIYSNTLEFNITDKNTEEASDIDDLPSDSSTENNQESETSETESESFPETIDDDINVHFQTSIHGDTTGNWRLARVATEKQIQTYALEYYNSYFQSDDEIHAVINFTLNTTNKLTKISSDILDIVIYDYTEKEEIDAKILFSGTVLDNYQINISTGDINQISLDSEQPEEDDGNAEIITPTSVNNSDNTNTNNSDNTNADNPDNQTITPPSEPSPDMVWIDDTGKKYHSKSTCSNMDAPYQVTREQAIGMGREACKRCY